MRSAAGWRSIPPTAGDWSWRARATLRIGTPRTISTEGSGSLSRRRRENRAAHSLGGFAMSPGAGRAPMGGIAAFHQRPPDPEAWLGYYRNGHLPILRRIPG